MSETAARLRALEPAPEPPRTQRVRVGQHRVRVRIVGEGPPLLLINGIGANIEMWEPFLEHMTNRQVIVFDMPGAGGSSTPILFRPMFLYARLTAALIRKLGYDRVDVLGLSWGGAVAQHLAVAFRAPSTDSCSAPRCRARRACRAAPRPSGS